MGVVSNRIGDGQKGLGISIDGLKAIWPDCPFNLVLESANSYLYHNASGKELDSTKPMSELEQELRLEPPKDIEKEIQAKFTSDRLYTSTTDEILGLVIACLPLGKYNFLHKRKVMITDVNSDKLRIVYIQ